jgi:hypothetical protein
MNMEVTGPYAEEESPSIVAVGAAEGGGGHRLS